jgi:hypothetical protein
MDRGRALERRTLVSEHPGPFSFLIASDWSNQIGPVRFDHLKTDLGKSRDQVRYTLFGTML